jgi:hypothetical protein
MFDNGQIEEKIGRRSFIKRAVSIVATVGFFPVTLLTSGCSDDSDSVINPGGYVFPLAKGPLMDNGATPWYATLYLGNPRQKMTVMMDTGTTNFWVTSFLCNTQACSTKKYKYDPVVSTTYKTVAGATWQNNDLGAWGEFESLAGKDYVIFNDAGNGDTHLWMKFLSAILLDAPGSTNWHDLDMCGGVGFPVIFDAPDDPNKPESMLPVMLNQGLITSKVVSFSTNGDTGKCGVGVADPRGYDLKTRNELPLTSVAENLNLWTVELEQIFRNSAPLLEKPVNFALDTGSSRFKGSPTLIEYLIDQITKKPDGQRLPTTFSEPALLEEFPVLTFEINGQDYVLQPEDYIWKIEKIGLYSLQFHPLELGDDNTILVGSVFLDHVYSVFEYENDREVSYGIKGSKVILYNAKNMS